MAKDELIGLFRERFHGHEAEVGAGVWEGIQSQLTLGAAVEGMDPVNEVFRTRFEGHELEVDPSLWQGIESQLAEGAAAGTGSGAGWGLMGKVAAVAGTVVVAVGIYLALDKQAPIAEELRHEQAVEAPVATVENASPSASVEGNEHPAPVQEAFAAPAATAIPANTQARAAAQPQRSPATGASPVPEPRMTDQPDGTPATTPDELGPGAEIVERIIAQMTAEAEQQARAATTAKAPPPAPEGKEQGGTVTDPEETVQELPAEPFDAERYRIFLQNAFTPNGDGHNDTYLVEPGPFAQMRIRIFSVRTGQLVFSTDTNEPWTGDGHSHGHYLVAVEAVTPEGHMVTAGQTVMLLRDTNH